MKLLNEFINDYATSKIYSYEKNYCNKLFNIIVNKDNVNEDIYYTAKAFTSIVNQIVNKKIDYINLIASEQIDLLTFLNTFDDKYLSNMNNLLEHQNYTEQIFITELNEDIVNIVSFLEDLLENLTDLSKSNKYKKFNIKEELKNIISELEEKERRGEI